MTTLLDLFDAHRRERPEAVAVAAAGESEAGASETERRVVGYGELFAAVERTAGGLAARGTTPGDRVALVAGNRLETVIAALAVLRAGAVAVPVNVAYTARETAHLLADSAPRAVVVERAYREEVERAIEESRRAGGRAPEILDLADVASPAETVRTPLPMPVAHDPALLVYTSGTTGRSKGAVLSHGNLAATVTGLRSAWGWRADDRLLLTLPLFHVHGLVVGLFTALASGARVELRRRFRAAEAARELAAGAATLFFGVPTMYVRLLDALPDRDQIGRLHDLGALPSMRLFASGSAPLSPETFEAFRRRTGHAILERYGMSETGMNLSNPYEGERRPGTVGLPLPGVEVRIVDARGKDVPDGAAGELAVRGPNVFAGYWRDPAKTAESFLPGPDGARWFRTGDLARRDPASGYVTLLGRSRELILRGGLNVYPREIEEVLEGAPGVREAAVVGRPHREYGEVPVAYVVAEPGAADDELARQAILAHCRERLAAFKVPEEVRFVPELPRTALGKVQKHRLGTSAHQKAGRAIH